MATSKKYGLAEQVVLQRLEAEIMLINMASEAIYTLTGSGIDVLDLLLKPMAIDDVSRYLSDNTDASFSLITDEVQRIVEELVVEGLVVEV